MSTGRTRFDPTNLGYIGFLAVPGWFVEGMRPLSILGLFFLFWLWPYVSMFGTAASRAERPTDWVDMRSGYYARYLLTLVPTMVNPFVVLTSLGQVLGQVVILWRYGGKPPGLKERNQTVAYRLPFDDTWTVINGSVHREHSHSWSAYTQRYAYDFLVTDKKRRTYQGSGTKNGDYHCFGRPVLAPADGVVVEVRDGHRDSPWPGGWLYVFQRDIRGNSVTIDHGGEYSVLAHLKLESITVEEGQKVGRGEIIGRCGNSGNSTEPHLHFHVQDHPNFFLGMGLPVAFDSVEVRCPSDDTTESHERVHVEAGQQIRSRTQSNFAAHGSTRKR